MSDPKCKCGHLKSMHAPDGPAGGFCKDTITNEIPHHRIAESRNMDKDERDKTFGFEYCRCLNFEAA